MKINSRKINSGEKPYVIAEMSGNHNGDIKTALNIIKSAKENGADAVKLQTYTPDTMTVQSDNEDFLIGDGLWQGKTLYDLYQWAHTPWSWHEELFDYAHELDLTIFSTPFDKTAVDLLEDLNTPAYKIASFEANDLQLIKYAASTRKPMIISTGMANETEIEEAINVAKENGCEDLAILHCVSGYPAPSEEYNLQTILDMKQRYGITIGLSDHTLNNVTAISSIALGACIIEKHITLDRNGGGPDDSFSLEPNELRALCEDVYTAWLAVGEVNYKKKPSEESNLIFRRSLYFMKDLEAGSTITEDSIRSIRPGYGLQPIHYEDILGRTLTKDVKQHTPVSLEDID